MMASTTLNEPSSEIAAARNRFLAACSLAGAATTTFRTPTKDRQETACVDIARLGSPDAGNVLVLSCGMNGEEGFCGSTIMSEWLSSGRQSEIPRNVGLVMLHTILPPGCATGSAPVPEKKSTQSWSDTVLTAAARRFASYAEKTGLKATNEATDIATPETENLWLKDASNSIVDDLIEHAAQIALLEFHTSLRPYGAVSIASCHGPTTQATERLKSWFGDDALSGDAATLDLFALGFGDRLTDQPLTAAQVEFGVYSMQGILQLKSRQNAAERHADMRAFFSPQTKSWKEHIYAHGSKIVAAALRGLAAT